jgi:hypothetical protein
MWELTRIGIRGVEVSNQYNIQDDGQRYGSETESPHNQLVPFSCADDGIKGCSD